MTQAKAKAKAASSDRSRRAKAMGHRLERLSGHSPGRDNGLAGFSRENVALDCGWGRLVFAQTFADSDRLVEAITDERDGSRNIAFYVRDPHVLLSHAPQELFLDPSHAYRLHLSDYRTGRRRARGFFVRRLSSEQDARAVNTIYGRRGMVTVEPDFFWRNRDSRALTYLVAEDETSGEVIGTVTGVDHSRLFGDPERGASLWCLAVDPQARHPGIGEMLIRRLAEHFQARGASHLDLSVLHDNEVAIPLYEKLGFVRVPIFAVKRKNPINESLFAEPPDDYAALNPYARLIVDEAHRRGVHVEITDAEGGFLRMTHGGRSIRSRESLSELTSGVAMSICDDKAVTRRVVEKAGLLVPAQIDASDKKALQRFLDEHGSLVIKPARGEQGRGVAVGLTTMTEVDRALRTAREVCDRVLAEACFDGEDLRLVVIDHKLVAAALRLPPQITGDGRSDIRTLIEQLSKRRAKATGGESRVPLDGETLRTIREQGHDLDSVPDLGKEITVRRTANLHTGGSIHDVTGIVHPRLVDAAIAASRAIDIPVVGVDLMVKAPTEPDYVFIEANERPGLANHEPQPTAERFLDLLFPSTRIRRSRRLAEAEA